MPQPLKYILWVVVPLVLVFCVLNFGNPQWKWCYILQSHTPWNSLPPGYLNPPKGFSGVWKTWNSMGELFSETTIVNGKAHGIFHSFYPNGTISSIHIIENGIDKTNQRFDTAGKLMSFILYHKAGKSTIIYDRFASPPIDLRPQYADEIAKWEERYEELEKELK